MPVTTRRAAAAGSAAPPPPPPPPPQKVKEEEKKPEKKRKMKTMTKKKPAVAAAVPAARAAKKQKTKAAAAKKAATPAVGNPVRADAVGEKNGLAPHPSGVPVSGPAMAPPPASRLAGSLVDLITNLLGAKEVEDGKLERGVSDTPENFPIPPVYVFKGRYQPCFLR
ncbi:hypothetical protein EG329_012004 [Mollisiaceae sp. DMI_Dod_QoI]|nr:hypothetical protein EG329_012004 [Helotiales sp. DMI_Dod_QoI]